jgi:hypothetical protein
MDCAGRDILSAATLAPFAWRYRLYPGEVERQGRASGVEVCHTMLIMKDGKGWAFPAADKAEAETDAAAMRDFLAITA